MSPKEAMPGIPPAMTRAAGRYFASDWESSSFIEFFVDLQLRVVDEAQAGVGRTVARLQDHARFALQVTILRSVDSYLAYLGEIESTVNLSRRDGLLGILDAGSSRQRGVPIDAGDRFQSALTHGNARQLGRVFTEATDINLFADPDDVAIVARLISIRNLVAHGRTFASDELASLVDETVSVGGLGLRWRDIRHDLDFLRASVVRIDDEIASRWRVARPVSREALFAAIAAAAKLENGEMQSISGLSQNLLET